MPPFPERAEPEPRAAYLATNEAHSRALAKGFHRQCVDNEQRFYRSMVRAVRAYQRPAWLHRMFYRCVAKYLTEQVVAAVNRGAQFDCIYLTGRTATEDGLDFAVRFLRFTEARSERPRKPKIEVAEAGLVATHHAVQRLYQRNSAENRELFACLLSLLNRLPVLREEFARRRGRLPDNRLLLRDEHGVFITAPDRREDRDICLVSFLDDAKTLNGVEIAHLAPGIYAENERRPGRLERIGD